MNCSEILKQYSFLNILAKTEPNFDLCLVDQGSANILAALIAGIFIFGGWYVSARIEKAKFSNAASYDYLLDSPKKTEVFKLYRDDVTPGLMYQRLDFAYHCLSQKQSDIKGRSVLISHFEYMAVSVRLSLVSESFMYLCEKSIISSAYQYYSTLINDWRKKGHKTVCENFETLAFRFYFDQPPFEQRLIEWITGYKLFSISRFHMNLFLLSCEIRNINLIEKYKHGDWNPLKTEFTNFGALLWMFRALFLYLCF